MSIIGIMIIGMISWSLTAQEENMNAESGLIKNNDVGKKFRMLGIDINEGKNTEYIVAIDEVKEIGVDFVQLSLTWDMVEMSPNQYNDKFLELINWIYSSRDMEVMLQIAPIEHRVTRVTEDLKDKPFDDYEVISRYNKMIDHVYEKIPDIKISGIIIGNEISAHMDSSIKWDAYEEFYKQVSQHIKSKERWENVPVGVKTMFTGITKYHTEEIMSINKYSDVIMVTYYPLNNDFTFRDPSVVDKDMQLIIEKSEGKPIYFLEAGYSSGNTVNSSTEKQKKFIVEMFKAWDKHSEHVKVINFVWMHDILEDDVSYYNEYYGIRDPVFSNYLSTWALNIMTECQKMLGLH